MRFYFFVTLLLGFLGVCSATARQVSCRFLCFRGNAPTVMAPTGKDSSAALEVTSGMISEATLCYAEDNQMIFLGAGAEEKPVAIANIPSTAESLILVFIPNHTTAETALSWKVLAIDDSPERFPPGGVFVGNFQPQEIRFSLGEQKNMLKSGAVHAFPKPVQVDTFNMARTSFEFRKDTKWRTASESSMRFVPTLRYLIFGYLDSASDRPRLAIFEDR